MRWARRFGLAHELGKSLNETYGWSGPMTARQEEAWWWWLHLSFPDRFAEPAGPRRDKTKAELRRESALMRMSRWGKDAKMQGRDGKLYDVDGKVIQ